MANQASNSAVIGAKQARAAVVLTTKSVAPTETHLETDSTAGAFTMTMPYSYECPAGRPFTIRHIVDGGDVTVAFKTQEGIVPGTAQVITVAGGYTVLVPFEGGWAVADSKLS